MSYNLSCRAERFTNHMFFITEAEKFNWNAAWHFSEPSNAAGVQDCGVIGFQGGYFWDDDTCSITRYGIN